MILDGNLLRPTRERLWRVMHAARDQGRIMNLPRSMPLDWPA